MTAALASSGSADVHTLDSCSATGSHSRFQVFRVLSSQSLAVHATARVVPAGRGVTPSSQVSASRTASEIAVLVTDAELNILGEGVDVVIHADDDALGGMIDVVTRMHTRSGLIDEVRASTIDVPTAEAMVLDYIRTHVKAAKTAPLAGNSIATDRGFIARDMPALDSYLHYRMIDVSSIKELCRRWYPKIYYGQPEKGLAHRALADIEESIRELRYYRSIAFVPLPGLPNLPHDPIRRASDEEVYAEDAIRREAARKHGAKI